MGFARANQQNPLLQLESMELKATLGAIFEVSSIFHMDADAVFYPECLILFSFNPASIHVLPPNVFGF